MPYFKYTARDATGKSVGGIRSALSAEDLAFQLQTESLIPIDIHLSKKAAETLQKTTSKTKWFEPQVTKDDLQMFCRQMYAVLKAGIPIGIAVGRLAETTRNSRLAQTLQQILVGLNQGHPLNLSLLQFPTIFSDFFVNLVKIGENTGNLDVMFLHLSQYLELETDTVKKVKTALRYPVLVLIAVFMAVLVINAFVVPAFATLFKSFHGTLPLPTRILIHTSDFILRFWYILLGLIIGGIFGFRYYIKTKEGELQWSKMLLKIPIVGWLIHRIILARFAKLYALVLKAGLTAVEGLELVGASTSNAYVAKQIMAITGLVGRGSTISSAIDQTQLFPPLVVQMITIGEETGNIDQLLEDVADFYQREINYDLLRISDAIEPIMLAIMGVMVLILALGVFLPMWEMASFAKQ